MVAVGLQLPACLPLFDSLLALSAQPDTFCSRETTPKEEFASKTVVWGSAAFSAGGLLTMPTVCVGSAEWGGASLPSILLTYDYGPQPPPLPQVLLQTFRLLCKKLVSDWEQWCC